MDSMLEHPGIELQLLIKEKGLTQKAFASILGKKVSEVNELLKGKRNITIQRDYLLHQTLGTPIKYWILKQIDYDYSLLDTEESDNSSFGTEGKILGGSEQNTQDSSFQTPQDDSTAQANHSEHSEESSEHNDRNSEPNEMKHENPSSTTPIDSSLQSKGQEKLEDEIQVTPLDKEKKEEIGNNSKNDEDLRNRAKIFRSF